MRLLPSLVQRRKKKRRKDRNDRNYYEKFYKSKSNFPCHLFFSFPYCSRLVFVVYIILDFLRKGKVEKMDKTVFL